MHIPCWVPQKTSAHKNTDKTLQQHANVVSSFFFHLLFLVSTANNKSRHNFGKTDHWNPYWEKYQLHTPFVWPFFSQTTCHWTNNIWTLGMILGWSWIAKLQLFFRFNPPPPKFRYPNLWACWKGDTVYKPWVSMVNFGVFQKCVFVSPRNFSVPLASHFAWQVSGWMSTNILDVCQVGGFNPFEKYEFNWIISPIFGVKNTKYLKPPTQLCVSWCGI